MKMMIKKMAAGLVVFAAIALATGCGEANHEEHKDSHGHSSEVATSAVPLNNGSKWKLDESTRQNIAGIRHTVMDTTFADNAAYAAALKTGTDQLVKQCRMAGPDHDALHVWLSSFLDHQKQLGNTAEAETAKQHLKDDISNFEKAFE